LVIRINMLTPEIVISALPPETERVYIAYSGGIDSHVLLQLASQTEFKSKITAVYVHHGLQEEADSWAQHCEQVCQVLDVKFKFLKVNAKKSNGQSPEEVARDARYSALKNLLAKNDVLLLGQHREDQLETVLLQLFRGAGVQGLSGMPLTKAIGNGILCRPFLNTPKQVINNYAIENGLNWVEDPSNKNDDFDRNFLRNTILPQLRQRWPAIDKTVARSARHCANAFNITEDLANNLLSKLYEKQDQTLNITHLLELDIDKQHLVIRQWFSCLKLRMPSEKNLQRIINEVVLARSSANPEVQGQGYCIKRYRHKLFCLIPKPELALIEQQWPKNQKILNLNDEQQLQLIESDAGILKSLWLNSVISLRFRKGTEKIRLPGRSGHHTLKKLYQEKGIPPWERNDIPLIYINNNLAVVVGVGISADTFSNKKGECYQINRLVIE